MALRYVFMGSPPFAATILERLCEEYAAPALIVTQAPKEAGRGRAISPTAVEALGRKKGLEVLAVPTLNTPEHRERLTQANSDLFLVAAFGQMLKDDILAIPKLFSLNVHASLLPKYRGAAPIQWAILNGDKSTGIAIQRMVRKLDAGDVLLSEETEILANETSGELFERLAILAGDAVLRAFRQIESGKFHFTPQKDADATQAPKIDRSQAPLDWTKSAETLRNQIRGLQPWPVAETSLGGQKLKIFGATVQASSSSRKPGEIATDGKTFLHVGCGEGGALALTEIQLENRKRLDVKSFLMAFRGVFPFKQVDSK